MKYIIKQLLQYTNNYNIKKKNSRNYCKINRFVTQNLKSLVILKFSIIKK